MTFLHWPKKLIFCKELHGNIEIAMKYQQLENLESGWKWKYLVKKHREGELITRYVEAMCRPGSRGSCCSRWKMNPCW